MDLKDIKAIIDLMKKNSVSEFELEKEDFKIKLKRNTGGGSVQPVVYEEASLVTYTPPATLPGGAQASNAGSPSVAGSPGGMSGSGEQEIKSPMIGTFYRSPSPEAGPYVEVGMEVNPDTVVCIIEAMKVMNEIKAEAKGVITQVLVENGKPVEFGQPLFKIRPN
ncbi:MAG TPA: acetyl-CoA carboxylase biotin carboxyl carrier protein [Verrucomicrobiae bacterium]|nr:acetyl-CoA carboxylase biotin carboxyl carrier protein [Verrucomicrobiae bacterium]